MSSDGGRRVEARHQWVLTGDAFERLLSALAPERDQAAVLYEQLRQRTIGLLRWWGAAGAEELADETLDRVARRLADGTTLTAGSLGAYVRGVARLVFYESRRERFAPLTGRESAPVAPSDVEAAGECLDRCLAKMTAAERGLLIRYYGTGRKADLRRAIADELRISMTALRIRMHRMRLSLGHCLTACLERRNIP